MKSGLSASIVRVPREAKGRTGICPYCHGVAWVRPAQLAVSNIRGEETQKRLSAAWPEAHGELSGCILEESRAGLCLPGGARRHGQRRVVLLGSMSGRG